MTMVKDIGSGALAASPKTAVTVSSTLAPPQRPTASVPLIGYGSTSSINGFMPATGNSPYQYTWLYSYNGGPFSPANATLCASPSGFGQAAGSGVTCAFTAASASAVPAGMYSFVLQVYDNATLPESSQSQSVLVDVGPVLLVQSNPHPNVGQTETYTVYVAGNMAPFSSTTDQYSATVYVDNSSAGTAMITGTGSGTVGVVEQAAGNFSAYAAVQDTSTQAKSNSSDIITNFLGNGMSTTIFTTTSTTSVFTTISTTSTSSTSTTSTSTTSIFYPMTTPTTPISSAPFLDVGQAATFSTSVYNGVSPYSYNFIVSYAANDAVIAFGVLNTPLASYTTTSAGTFRMNVIVTDNEIVPASTVSSYSSAFTVYTKPAATVLTPSAASLTLGQSVTFNVIISGGKGPFILQLSNGIAVNTVTVLSAGIVTFGPILPPFATDTYNVIAADMGPTNPYAFNSVSNTVTVAGAPVTTTTTSVPTTSTIGPTTTIQSIAPGSVGSGPSAPGGPGGGGSILPTVLYSGSCFTISNMTQAKSAAGTLNGTSIGMRVNFIGPTQAGITVNNGTSYTLLPGAVQSLFNVSGYSYTAELMNITYVPVLHTVAVEVCGASPASLSASGETVLVVNNSGMVTSRLITSTHPTTNMGFWPGTVELSVPSNSTAKTITLNLDNTTRFVPMPPKGYSLGVSVTLSVSTNSVLYTMLGYNCSINYTRIVPFLLKNGTWSPILPFSINPFPQCTVSFAVPPDPVVALMIRNQSAAATSTTTLQKPGGVESMGSYEIVVEAAILVIFALIVYFYIRRTGKGRRPKAPDMPPEAPYSMPPAPPPADPYMPKVPPQDKV